MQKNIVVLPIGWRWPNYYLDWLCRFAVFQLFSSSAVCAELATICWSIISDPINMHTETIMRSNWIPFFFFLLHPKYAKRKWINIRSSLRPPYFVTLNRVTHKWTNSFCFPYLVVCRIGQGLGILGMGLIRFFPQLYSQNLFFSLSAATYIISRL